jgi:arylsulfatase B
MPSAPSASSMLRVAAAAAALACAAAANAPKVILTVIVDDLGHRNVGWHQDSPPAPGDENATPHLTSLAREGVILDRHVVHFTCTPSRSSFLTGRLPVHVQQTLANPDVATAGIPRNMTALPAKLAEAGFSSHVVGK